MTQATSSAGRACAALADAGVELIACVPDSLLGPLASAAERSDRLRYVQACDEASAIGIAAGATLGGTRCLVIMENSGLRRACDTIGRFTIGQRLHFAALVSYRGELGERNWWGIGHAQTMHPHLEMYRMQFAGVSRIDDLADVTRRAFATLDARQCSVALIADQILLAELAGS